MSRVAECVSASVLFVSVVSGHMVRAQTATPPTNAGSAGVQASPARPTPPTRDPHTPGYVDAKELPDGQVPPADADGNFIIGPTHPRAPEMEAHDGVPQGTLYEFTMESNDSKYY